MSLSDVSYYIRKYFPFALLFFIIFLIFFYAFKLLIIYSQMQKPKTVYINPVFNKIKKPVIQNQIKVNNLSFTLDTIEGVPVTASQTANVYFLPSSKTRFGYREKIYLMAKNLGFDTETIKHKIVNEEAVFSDDQEELSIDIADFNFTYKFAYGYRPSIFENTRIPSRKEIEDRAIDFLNSIGKYPKELSQGKTNIVYLKYNLTDKELISTDDINEAQAVEIDFYRPDIGTYPIVSPKYFNSQNYLVMVFYSDNFKILKAQVRYFEKSDQQIGIYPLKTGDVVWNELKSGKGMVIVSSPNIKNVVIKKMFLGYFDPDIYQEYLQPVYVFLGDNNFVSYVPAVTNEYLE